MAEFNKLLTKGSAHCVNLLVETILHLAKLRNFGVTLLHFIKDLAEVDVLQDFQVLHFILKFIDSFALGVFELLKTLLLLVQVVKFDIQGFDQMLLLCECLLSHFELGAHNLLAFLRFCQLLP